MVARQGAFVLLITPLLLGGCVAQAALDLATAPVRMAGKAVDLVTTSQSEVDEKRGRELRQRDERLGQLEREHGRLTKRCALGVLDACRKAEAARARMAELLPTLADEGPR